MTEMESPLKDYADGLGFHFDGYFIWRLLCRRIEDALRIEKNPTEEMKNVTNFRGRKTK